MAASDTDAHSDHTDMPSDTTSRDYFGDSKLQAYHPDGTYEMPPSGLSKEVILPGQGEDAEKAVEGVKKALARDQVEGLLTPKAMTAAVPSLDEVTT